MNDKLLSLILSNPDMYNWEVQGLGMMRIYLSREVRLQIWHQEFCFTPAPTALHNHPWRFHSTILAGTLHNTRFERRQKDDPNSVLYTEIEINCGPNACAQADTRAVYLEAMPTEDYFAGDTYVQAASEIHATQFSDGTVTAIQRFDRQENDVASVFGLGEHAPFLTAQPRPATRSEIHLGCLAALSWLS